MMRAILGLVVVFALGPPATAGDLVERAIESDQPRPVTTQGPFAGFVATPQVFYFGAARAFLIAPNGRWFASNSNGAGESGIRLMDMRTGVLLRVLRTAGGPLKGVAISADSATVEALTSQKQRISWDAATGEMLSQENLASNDDRVLYDRLDKIDGLTDFVYEQRHEQNPDYSRTVEFLRRHKLSEQFPDPTKIDRILRSADGRYAIVTEASVSDSNASPLRIWDLQRPSPPWTVKIPDDWPGFALSAFAFDGHFLVLGNSGGEGDTRYTDSGMFEMTNGELKPIWRQAPEESSWEGPCEISPNARFFSIGPSPNGPVTVWDTDEARRVVEFDPAERAPTISPDSTTFAVVRGPDDNRSAPQVMVFRRGRRVALVEPTADWPRDSTRLDIRALSSNGRYLVTSMTGIGRTSDPNGKFFVEVWDIDAARRIDRFSLPDEEGLDWAFARVSNEGKLLLGRKDTVFRSGNWVRATDSDNALIAPLDKGFEPVCGVVFCDRVLADLGVVERVAPKDARVAGDKVRIGNFTGNSRKVSPNGRLMIGKLFDNDNGSYREPGIVVDVETGRTLLETRVVAFTADSRFAIESDGEYAPITLRDISSGKRLWTLYATPDLGFLMTFPDGRIRATAGAEQFVKLVRGFEVKPYDQSARPLFQK